MLFDEVHMCHNLKRNLRNKVSRSMSDSIHYTKNTVGNLTISSLRWEFCHPWLQNLKEDTFLFAFQPSSKNEIWWSANYFSRIRHIRRFLNETSDSWSLSLVYAAERRRCKRHRLTNLIVQFSWVQGAWNEILIRRCQWLPTLRMFFCSWKET